jgi:DNA-binding transcriptional LysR family regulator
LRLYVETLGAVVQPLLDGRCTLGVLGTVTLVPQHFGQERLLDVPFIHVTSPRHPLASYGRPIPSAEVAKHVQLVLTDRSALTKGREFGVFSPRTWRLADLGAKHAFLRAALGWGGMPAELVQADIARGALVKIVLEDAPANFAMGMSVVYRTDAPPGTAGRWFINQLKRDPAVVGTKLGRHLTAAAAQKKRAKR